VPRKARRREERQGGAPEEQNGERREEDEENQAQKEGEQVNTVGDGWATISWRRTLATFRKRGGHAPGAFLAGMTLRLRSCRGAPADAVFGLLFGAGAADLQSSRREERDQKTWWRWPVSLGTRRFVNALAQRAWVADSTRKAFRDRRSCFARAWAGIISTSRKRGRPSVPA